MILFLWFWLRVWLAVGFRFCDLVQISENTHCHGSEGRITIWCNFNVSLFNIINNVHFGKANLAFLFWKLKIVRAGGFTHYVIILPCKLLPCLFINLYCHAWAIMSKVHFYIIMSQNSMIGNSTLVHNIIIRNIAISFW